MVKFAVEFWWKMLLTIFPSKRSSKISFQTSPEVLHQFRRKLRQLHSGNRWCLLLGHFLNSTWNYNSHETTTFECPSSTHRGPKVATTVKRRLLHLAIIERYWEANVALTTTAKLQQLRVNSREMTTFAESCNDREMQRPWNDKLETWADPGVLWKKAPRAMRAMRGKTLETVPFQPYFGCTKSFLKVLSSDYCQATRAMRAKQVVAVPLQPYFGFHWKLHTCCKFCVRFCVTLWLLSFQAPFGSLSELLETPEDYDAARGPWHGAFIRKSVVSIKFPPVILGPEMAALILWAPGIFWFFLLENPMPIKFLLLGGGVLGFFRRRGWKCQFYFYGRGDFSDKFIKAQPQGGRTNVPLSNVHVVLRDISALLDPSWGSRLPTLIHLVWKQ